MTGRSEVATAELSASDVAGVWSGTYRCRQGETGVRLALNEARGNLLRGVFEFYPTSGNPHAPSGSFNVEANFDTASGQLTMSPGRWIERPSGYYTVAANLTLSPDLQTLRGRIITQGCGAMQVHREVAR